MKIFNTVDHNIAILALVQIVGSYQCVSKLIEIGYFKMELGIGKYIVLPYLLLSLLGIFSAWLLLKNNNLGLLLAKIHFAFQVPYFEIQKFLYEYYTSFSIRLYTGEPKTGFDFLTGSTYRVGVNLEYEYWAIGVNIAPILFFYLIFRLEETKSQLKKNSVLVGS
jgi:hypothetical protein